MGWAGRGRRGGRRAADDRDCCVAAIPDRFYRVVPGLTFEMCQAGKMTREVEAEFVEVTHSAIHSDHIRIDPVIVMCTGWRCGGETDETCDDRGAEAMVGDGERLGFDPFDDTR